MVADKQSKKESSSKGVQSIEVGFELIRVLNSVGREMSLKELAAATGMSPSKAHTYLVSFRKVGLIVQNPRTSHYDIGPFAGELGLTRLARQQPLKVAERAIHLLREHKLTGSMFVSTWSERGPVIVSRDGGNGADVPFDIRVGYHSPLLHTATGRVFLAYLHSTLTSPLVTEERRDQKRGGSNLEMPSDKQLAEIVADIRHHGVALVDNLLLPGLVGLAAPILDQSEWLGAVLTLIGRSGSTDFTADGELARLIKQAANDAHAS